MTEPEYTEDQIIRAKKCFELLFPTRQEDREQLFVTGRGTKSNTGVINLILTVMYNPADKGG